MGTQKLTAIWHIVTSKSFHLFYQRNFGEKVDVIAKGHGGIMDMVLVALSLKEQYNNFVGSISDAAVDGGELHFLEELKKTLGTLEKK